MSFLPHFVTGILPKSPPALFQSPREYWPSRTVSTEESRGTRIASKNSTGPTGGSFRRPGGRHHGRDQTALGIGVESYDESDPPAGRGRHPGGVPGRSWGLYPAGR